MENIIEEEKAKFTKNKLKIPDESAELLNDLILDDNNEKSSITTIDSDLIDNLSSTFTSCFPVNDYAETKLLKTLTAYNAPHTLYKNIIDWVTES